MALIANTLLLLLSLAMGLRLFAQYSRRRRMHTLWYAVGLVLIAAAALPEVWLKITGGLVTPLWWLYWVSASALVGFLGVGTAYLLNDRAGQIALAAAAVLTTWLAVATLLTAGPAPAIISEAMLSKAPNAFIKMPFLIQNIAGALLIFAAAIWSFIRNRGMYNLYIALGTLVFSAGGAAAGLLRFPGAFYFTQTAGILLLYTGVTLSTAPRAPKTVMG